MRVLLVDDDHRNIELLDEILTFKGHDCCLANSVDLALEALKKDPSIQLIITDINMPEKDGLQLIEAVLEGETDPPRFIILSGKIDDKIRERVRGFEAKIHILEKPLDVRSLMKIIDAVGSVRSE